MKHACDFVAESAGPRDGGSCFGTNPPGDGMNAGNGGVWRGGGEVVVG